MRIERWRKQRTLIPGDWRVALIAGLFLATFFVFAVLWATHIIPYRIALDVEQRGDSWYVIREYICNCEEIAPGDRVVAVDGTVPRGAQQIADAQRLTLQRGTVGTLYDLGRPDIFDASLGDLALVLFISSAIVFISVSMLVYMWARQRVAATLFMIACTCIGNLLFITVGTRVGAAPLLLSLINVGLVYLGGATFLHFFVIFPAGIVLPRLPRVGRWLGLHQIILLSYATGAIGFGITLVLLAVVGVDAVSATNNVSDIMAYFHLVTNIGVALLVVIAKFVAARSPRAKRESRCVAITFGLSFAYFFVMLVVNTVARFIPFSRISYIGSGYVALMFAILPLGIAYAILQYQSFGIRNLLRRNVVYGAAAALLFAGYGIIFFPLENAMSDTGLRLALMALFCVVVAASFTPLHRLLQRLADTYIFKDFYDYNQTVHSLTARLAEPVEVDELAQVVIVSLAHLLNLEGAAFVLRHADTDAILQRSIVPACPRQCTAAQPLAAMLPGLHLPEAHHAYLVWPQPDDPPFVAVALAVSPHVSGLLVLAARHNDEMFTARDISLIETLGRALAVSLHKALLVADLHDKITNLERTTAELEALTQQVLTVSEGERVRLAREIHDDPLQQLMLILRQFDADDPTITARERYCWRVAQDVSTALRSICTSLRPPILTDLGLSAALDSLVTRQRRETRQDITLYVDLDARLTPNVETALYRVAQEGLQNALNHANATSIHLALAQEGQAISLCIEDDGRGVALPLDSPTLIRRGHLGLVGMRERMHAVGGELHLSSAHGHGTRLEARVANILN